MNLDEEDGKGKFTLYIEELEETIFRKLFRSARRKVFRTPNLPHHQDYILINPKL